jgi:acyl carrier protein
VQNIEEEIRNIIAEIIEKDPAEISPEARFFEDLSVDSMMALEIMTAIEKKYKIAIPEDKLTQIRTLKDTVALAREYLEKKENSHAGI